MQTKVLALFPLTRPEVGICFGCKTEQMVFAFAVEISECASAISLRSQVAGEGWQVRVDRGEGQERIPYVSVAGLAGRYICDMCIDNPDIDKSQMVDVRGPWK